MDQLARLVAIQEISDLIGRYCMAFDDEDWAPLDTMWTRLFHARRDFKKILAERGITSLGDLDALPGGAS